MSQDRLVYVLKLPESFRMSNPILRYFQDIYNEHTDATASIMEIVPYYDQNNLLVVEQSTLQIVYNSDSGIDLSETIEAFKERVSKKMANIFTNLRG